ncbi:MAG: hypothetical protein ACLUFI_07790 [Oscillospiraceae bacterium]
MPSALQKRAEDDEQHDVGIADADRRADDTARGVEQLIDDVLERLIEAGVVAQLVIERIDDQKTRHDQDRQTHAAAAQLDEHQNADDADDDMDGLDARGELDHRHRVEGKIEETARADHHQQDVVPGQVIRLHMVLAGGEIEEAREHDKAHEAGQADLRHGRGKQRHANAQQGKGGHKDLDHGSLPAGPDPGVGFAVIFAHDLINVGGNVLRVVAGSCGGVLVGSLGQGASLLLFFRFARQLRQGTPAVVVRKPCKTR